ncbi:ATP-dependent protease La Type I [Mycoplasmopsis meleagridis]|uniref:endopeptidase La n=2 Tax=Mycoplasmopsis meleagridis TaxID=29561 RepID=A0A0F5H105_9BACT|nr:endopeptidase La [Mycoplasmopsis meleagridis]KKB26984.1 ATP-dependent protease La type I [Mycoplasmopsis meleagridis ATCC 25294]OAD18331.1 ATP-dependent protease La Type I [Mycoplasmopsis meleagridis]VEU77461.1 ATP-dependent protease La [Mycoplasmopsis meleagridis]
MSKNIKTLVYDLSKSQKESWVFLESDYRVLNFEKDDFFNHLFSLKEKNKLGENNFLLTIYHDDKKEFQDAVYFKNDNNLAILKYASLVKIIDIELNENDNFNVKLVTDSKVEIQELWSSVKNIDKNDFDKVENEEDVYLINKVDYVIPKDYEDLNELVTMASLNKAITSFDEALTSIITDKSYARIVEWLTKENKNGLNFFEWSKLIDSYTSYISSSINEINSKILDNTNKTDEELLFEPEVDSNMFIVAFALHTVLNNFDRYRLFAFENMLDQIDFLMHKIALFPNCPTLSKEEIIFLSKYSALKESAEKRLKEFKKDEINNEVNIENKVNDWDIEQEIQNRVKENLDKQQKEFLLREKMRAIKESLRDNNSSEDDLDEYSKNLKDPIKMQMYPSSVIKLITSEEDRLKGTMQGTPDANIMQTYLKTLKSLPWRKTEIESLDIQKVKEILDKNHYGLKSVKERIIEYLSLIINRKNIEKSKVSDKPKLLDLDDNHQIDLDLFKENSNSKVQKSFNNVPILTLVGPPGTGKTSLARAIAEALNKSYIKISLGGVNDESEIRGHRRTYVGAMPGKIIKAIQKVGVSNPLILLDEIDKVAQNSHRGDVSSAMLEVLDPEQNTKFQDNYLEHEYDLSKVMFFATANYYENIPAPLLDRVEIIELSSYTLNEKLMIAKNHLIKEVLEQAGISDKLFQINDEMIEFIIKHYTIEAGVRGLKRELDKIARKIVTKIVAGEKIEEFKITKDVILDFLGVQKFDDNAEDQKPEIGVVNGLAYTAYGGTTLQIEVTTYKSKNGGIRLTGSLKDVMKESANIALTYVKANAEKFDIKDFDFETNEIHIHVPEGAVPKDGPSAGITFTTALISALSNKPVSKKVAMTGEITLRGKVLPIGGLKEKTFAAYKKGVKKVFIPHDNAKNLVDIAEEVKDAIEFIPVKNYDEIYERLFK